MTCLRLDWRTYKSAVLDRWAAVTFDAAVSGSIGVSFGMGSGYGGGPVMVPASATAARALMSSAATGTGSPAGGAGCVPGGGRPVPLFPGWRGPGRPGHAARR